MAGRRRPIVERFGPFLRAAWESRHDLPADEQNGVIPLDSKFGFAWRDWRVLKELAQRTGRRRLLPRRRPTSLDPGRSRGRQAGRDASGPDSPASRLVADRPRTGSPTRSSERPAPCLRSRTPTAAGTRTTSRPVRAPCTRPGQLIDTLLELGLPRDHPAVARALRYLLPQQQDFGGWFQTTTHENFRTPMRETRYAVMALARAFPRTGPH